MASASITSTTGANFIPEIWSKNMIVVREQNLVFAKLFNRVTGEFNKGDILHFPNLSHLTAASKSTGITNTIAYEAITENVTDLTVNQHYYTAFAEEDFTKFLADYDLQAAYQKRGAYGMALQIDDFCGGFIDDFSQVVGTLAVPSTDEDLRRAVQYLDDANTPEESRYWVMSPAAKNDAMAIEKYIHADYGTEGPVTKGRLPGSIYNLSMYISTNVEGSNAAGHDNGVFHKEAVTLAMRQDIRTQTFYDIDVLATKVVIDAVWGGIETRDDHGVWLKGS